MTEIIKEIDYINFGVYSAEEIEGMSICKLTNGRRTGANSVYDPRMGTTDDTDCVTCKGTVLECPGHFGHIELNESIVHPLYYRKVSSLLKCFCKKCYSLLITKEQIKIHGMDKMKGTERFEAIVEKIIKTNVCLKEDCRLEQPQIKFSPIDNSISLYYVESKDTKITIPMEGSDIFKIFDAVSDEDAKLIGMDVSIVHPRNFIIKNLLVLPPADRPFVKQEFGISDDDLTIQYCEIIKANNHLAEQIPDAKKQKCIQTLKFRISTTFNNSSCKAKHTTNGRPIKGIKERLSGKDGRIRNNVQGKRCDQSGRTVIGPDPTLDIGQICIPPEMATILTIPVYVSESNINKMQEIVNNGQANYVIKKKEKVRINLLKACFVKQTQLLKNDEICRNGRLMPVLTGKEILKPRDLILRNGATIPCNPASTRPYSIQVGDIVERKLITGDTVLFNRQPTLNKMSMQAGEIIVRPGKNIRVNLAVTRIMNADFDGDEFNIHVPQSLEATAELKYLSSMKENLISAQHSKPNVAIVQDSLLGSYLMTIPSSLYLKKEKFFDIIMTIDKPTKFYLDKINHIKTILSLKLKKPVADWECMNGKGLVSMILPEDFNYFKKNNGSPEEPTVKIHRGVLYKGVIDKNIIGCVTGTIIQALYKEYNTDIACEFVNGIQKLSNAWLLLNSFSIGLKDCLMLNKQKEILIKKEVEKCIYEAESIKNEIHNPIIKEARVNSSLNKAKDLGFKIAQDAILPTNNFLSTIKSGSKGDIYNLAQMTGLLGQQNLKGSRVQPSLNNKQRTLPHYKFGKLFPEQEYESKGFISSPFIKGLNPREFYFHACSGREGVSDTSLGTSNSGYIQRRIIKLTEDMKVEYDGSVRDAGGRVYQFAYGETNMDPSKTIVLNGKSEICDVRKMVEKLNMQVELEKAGSN
jgi:DNA-directed RNA polymerase beta' subunit